MESDSEENKSEHDALRDSRSSEIRFLVVDDQPEIRALLEHILIAGGLYGDSCTDGNEALTILRQAKFQVVLAELNMPGISGMHLLEEVRVRFPEVAFLMVTGSDDIRQVVRAIKVGASDYLCKPIQPDALIASVQRAAAVKRIERRPHRRGSALKELVRIRSKQLRRALRLVKKISEGALLALRSSLDLRDHETAGHCQRVTQYSYELAKAMNCTPAELKRIVRGAFLHDIGKIAIPDAILRKPGPLTDQERAIMEAHVRIGFDLTRHIPFFAGAAEIVLTHHERFDGTGYPQGLAGTKIPLGARIFAVADTLDAMTRDRPYRRALPYAVARGEMIRESGHQFDPAVVEAFLSLPEQLLQRIRDEAESAETPSETKSWNRLLKEPLRGARRNA